jgi:hypothetical protein
MSEPSTNTGGAWAVMVIGATVAWSAALMTKPIIVANGTPVGYLSDRMDLRLDPNVATAGELAAIVDLGEKHAQDIVAYRTRFQASHPAEPAFTEWADLENARGIGPKTAQMALRYLEFPPRPEADADVAVSKHKNKS